MLAAALSADPGLLVADEPSSALDPLTGAALLEQLESLRERRGLTLVLISHDLDLVARLAEKVTVVYAGETVEVAPRAGLFEAPAHPYTRALLETRRPVPARGPGGPFPAIPGSVPRPGTWAPGCRFEPRCPLAFAHCREARPALGPAGPDRQVRCFLHNDAEVPSA